ncbi:hypothetical protein [Gordonia zhaorongruii]|uniref:hypothetical protein n=1 Tax=Gordonia zhaorongruii TaxID=2597659 RepID=UPI0039A3BA06
MTEPDEVTGPDELTEPDEVTDPDEVTGPDETDEKAIQEASADPAEGPEDDEESADTADGTDSASAARPGEPGVEERGRVLFDEPGGSWWVTAIGPVLIGATLAMEIAGKGRIHWEVLTIFGVILIGFSVLQVVAARRHVSVRLTDCTLRQGVKVLELDRIEKIYPENRSDEFEKWESAPALGELHAVPRRRKGIGLKLTDGSLAQAWARDVDLLRTELSEAHLAVTLGLPPREKP